MKINKNIVMPGMRRKVTFIKLKIFRWFVMVALSKYGNLTFNI
jgi:hypothetical protein